MATSFSSILLGLFLIAIVIRASEYEIRKLN